MNRYGSEPAPNRLTTRVSTPISPNPRPASSAREQRRDQGDRPALAGADPDRPRPSRSSIVVDSGRDMAA